MQKKKINRYHMKKIFLILTTVVALSPIWGGKATAAPITQAEETAQKIMDSDQYLFGTGTGADRQEAM